MDLVFKRYSSPFFLLENLIIQKRFSEGIETIYKQAIEDKYWELYLSIPIKEKSYEDWKWEVQGGQQIEQPIKPFQHQKTDIEAAKDNAKNILKNFKP